LLTGLDAITIASGLTATMLGSQVTGLTLSVTGVAGGGAETLALTATSGSDTVSLSNLTLTNAVVTVSTGAGADTITGTGSADTITAGTGADTITGGAGADLIVIGDTDSGITVATADSVIGFVTTSDNLSLGLAGDATADTGNYVEAGAAVASFTAALTAANTALAVLNSTSAETTLYSFQWDTTNGYLFEDSNSDGVADQVIVLVGIVGGTFAAGDIDA
jgi:hypothetical protein